MLLQPDPQEYGQGLYPGGLLSPTPPFAAPQKPSMIQRIMDRFRPQAPAGFEGLLSPEEIQSARPSFLQSIIGAPNAPSSSQHYRNNLTQIAAMKQAAEQVRSQKQLSEARQRITAKYALPENATREQAIGALRGMMAEYAAIGDHEMVGKMAGYMSGADKSASEQRPQEINLGGEVELRYPDGRIERIKKTPSPRDPNAPDTAAQLRDQRMFQREQQLADDYNKDTKDSRELAVKVSGAVSEAAAAKAGDGVAQVNMLYAFVSSMDPGTAVREGELGLVRSASSLVQQAQGLLSK